MIVGANGGFGADDHEPRIEATWEASSYIADAQWPLAQRLRAVLAAPELTWLLDNAIQTNLQFFKSGSIANPNRYRWNDLPATLRNDLAAFSARELAGYVEVSQPRMILVLGLDTFDRHATDAITQLRDRSGKRRLLVEGRFFGSPAIGILHPTGAQVASEDWARVTSHLCDHVAARDAHAG